MAISPVEIAHNLENQAIHMIKIEKAGYDLYKLKIQHLIDCAKYAEKTFSDEALRVLHRLQDKLFYETHKEQIDRPNS